MAQAAPMPRIPSFPCGSLMDSYTFYQALLDHHLLWEPSQIAASSRREQGGTEQAASSTAPASRGHRPSPCTPLTEGRLRVSPSTWSLPQSQLWLLTRGGGSGSISFPWPFLSALFYPWRALGTPPHTSASRLFRLLWAGTNCQISHVFHDLDSSEDGPGTFAG